MTTTIPPESDVSEGATETSPTMEMKTGPVDESPADEAPAFVDAQWGDAEHGAMDVTIAGVRWRGVRREHRWGPSLWRWMEGGGPVAAYAPPADSPDAAATVRLAAIDRLSIRPLRAVLSGRGGTEDAARLAALEAEAIVLRAECAARRESGSVAVNAE